MTWPTALPGAALRSLRVLRGAAGRRVVQLAFLVGGLFALGFLCGEQAHAAEGLSAPALSAPALPVPALSAPALPVPALSAPALSVPAGVTDQGEGLTSVPAVGDESAGRLPRLPAPADLPALADLPAPAGLPAPANLSAPADLPGLADLADLAKLPVVSDLPALPDLPLIPDLPRLPALPSLPVLPALPGLPVVAVPVVEVPAAVRSSPLDGQEQEQEHGLGELKKTADAATATAAMDMVMGANRASYGPVRTGGLGRSADVGHRVASARTGHAPVRAPAPGPVRRGPGGAGDGVLGGGASVLDGGASRHGDTHAVTPCHRVPLRLVPGNAVRSDRAGARDGHRDVPVFPG